jgi:chromosomal replication initiator protein
VQDVSDAASRSPLPTVDEEDAGSVWEAARERLRTSIPEATFKMWLEPLRGAAVQGDVLYVTAPDGIRAWVQRRYSGLLNHCLQEATTGLREVRLAAPGDVPASGRAEVGGPAQLNPNYTFDRFVIGEGNRLAHAAALAVAEAPSEAYNPLFLHGPPGLGKTHLLVAIANYLTANAPQLSVRYTTAESFTNEFVAALHSAGAEQFKHRYRDLDVLLIDDVQFLEGKRHTEEEFFHTFNALYESGSQLVLSADRIPSELSTLPTRLRDRFEWGLTLSVEPPNLATRLVVLQRLVREAGIEIADREVLGELAGRIDANIRLLHGALTRALAHASLSAKPLSAELIADVIPGRAPKPDPLPELIQAEVANSFQVSRESIVGRDRSTAAVSARQAAIYLTRELTDLSLPQIGRIFGGRDHSTVLSSIRRLEARLETDPALRARLEELRAAIHRAGSRGR